MSYNAVPVFPPQAGDANKKSSSAIYRNVVSVPKLTLFTNDTINKCQGTYPEQMKGIKTSRDSFEYSHRNFGDCQYLGYRAPLADGTTPGDEYIWKTYAEVFNECVDVGAGLVAHGAGAGTEDPQIGDAKMDQSSECYDYENCADRFQRTRIGILGANCPEYMTIIHAINRKNFVSVPLYDTFGDSSMEYVLRHAHIQHIFCSDKKLPDLIRILSLPKDCSSSSSTDGLLVNQIKGVYVWDTHYMAKAATTASMGKLREMLAKESIVSSYGDLVALGGKASGEVRKATESGEYGISCLMYTSGTTGDPKGVLISHRNVLGMVAGTAAVFAKFNMNLYKGEDTYISYLPLAHIFDRIVEDFFSFMGAKIGYWRGDVTGLIADLQVLKPTIMAGVPRVFERVYQKISSDLDKYGLVKRAVINSAYALKNRFIGMGYKVEESAPILDKLVFSKAKEALGGRVRLLVSGGAPLAPYLEEFLQVFLCVPVIQGYGLTESCAASFLATPNDAKMQGSIGVPTGSVEFKLESVPEMNYNAYDSYYDSATNELRVDIDQTCVDLREASACLTATPLSSKARPVVGPVVGELLLRGPSVFTNYYRNDKLTREAIDSDGWFHTGDIAQLTPFNGVKIIDRKKNIFKLAQGEYIAVEKIELVYGKLPILAQFWVYGNSYRNHLVAIAVPNLTHLYAKVVYPLLEAHLNGTGTAETNGICKEIVSVSHGNYGVEHVASFMTPQLYAKLSTNPAVKKGLLTIMNTEGKKAGLKGFELIRDITIEPTLGFEFSVDNDLITSTYKLKRPQLLAHYKAAIDSMYG